MNKFAISVVTATLLIVGCGSGSSSSSSDGETSLVDSVAQSVTSQVEATPAPTPITKYIGVGYYVDSPIEGVDYRCGDQEGVTGESGEFKFEEGEDCTFAIGTLKLREVNSSVLSEDIHIVEDNITVAKLLQTLDKDGDSSNGIQILREVKDIAEENNIEEIPEDDAVLGVIRDELEARYPDEYNGTVVNSEEAQAHIDHTKELLESNGTVTQYTPNNDSMPIEVEDVTTDTPDVDEMIDTDSDDDNISKITEDIQNIDLDMDDDMIDSSDVQDMDIDSDMMDSDDAEDMGDNIDIDENNITDNSSIKGVDTDRIDNMTTNINNTQSTSSTSNMGSRFGIK